MSKKITNNDIQHIKIKELAQKYSEVALKTIVEIMQSDNASPSARLSAAENILVKAWGKGEVKHESKQSIVEQLVTLIQQLEKSNEKEINHMEG